MKSGFVRIAAGIPTTRVGHPQENADAIAALWAQSDARNAAVVVFPELALSGYTARDLFLQDALLEACQRALIWLRNLSRQRASLAVVGLPLCLNGSVYNCAVVIQAGRILGVVPKSYLPNYGEFEETRWFRPGHEIKPGTTIALGGDDVPIGTDILFSSAKHLSSSLASRFAKTRGFTGHLHLTKFPPSHGHLQRISIQLCGG